MCTLYLGLATSQNKARKTYVRVHVLVRRRVGACKYRDTALWNVC